MRRTLLVSSVLVSLLLLTGCTLPNLTGGDEPTPSSTGETSTDDSDDTSENAGDAESCLIGEWEMDFVSYVKSITDISDSAVEYGSNDETVLTFDADGSYLYDTEMNITVHTGTGDSAFETIISSNGTADGVWVLLDEGLAMTTINDDTKFEMQINGEPLPVAGGTTFPETPAQVTCTASDLELAFSPSSDGMDPVVLTFTRR